MAAAPLSSAQSHRQGPLEDIRSLIAPVRTSKASAQTSSQVFYPDTILLYRTSYTSRYTLEYNAQGLPVLVTVQYTTGSGWLNYTRASFVYDGSGNTLTELQEDWSGGHWINSALDTWTYHPDNSSVDVAQDWSGTQWVNATYDSSTFDVNGQMLVHLFAVWTGGRWQDSIHSVRTYDANGNMLTNVGRYMIDGSWKNHDQSVYTYNGNGYLHTYLFQTWEVVDWLNSDYRTYSYDGSGNLLEMVAQQWLALGINVWQNVNRLSNTYDAGGNVLTALSQSWSGTAWENASRTTNSYDAQEHLLGSLNETWYNPVWAKQSRLSFSYDANGNEVSGAFYGWQNPSWIPESHQFAVIINDGEYNLTCDSIRFSYTTLGPTAVSTEETGKARGFALEQNWPNPCNPSTCIGYTIASSQEQVAGRGTMVDVRLVVYDLLGHEVAVLVNGYQTPGEHRVVFNGSGLASGVYFYRLIAEGRALTKRLVLMK